ncbi:hypothetical protein LZQ00_05840 [Sphingobacterium sp. SRCM116780]|uniref:MauE/DoxX family redox-associated membrane protein n=1 Tax=Sphingobacterium sp. SRCM116780 TaxID=2907623 RepID=UPI001F18109B|nr:MauE/DoxX family redox-associated membrane protein [Sphingobacterium sp. SRCM116780]UIR57336.1 hypothetical protein LZQ00_05840 [Sphingobacterium sp. SRCM116780]
MNTKKILQMMIVIALMLLWIPISLDKFNNFELFKSALLQQPFPDELGKVLAYLLPTLELGTGLLLLYPKTRIWGLGLSAVLMVAFTTYVGLALLQVWKNLPCGCGLVFQHIGWTAHFWLNLFFLTISSVSYLLEKQIRNT